MVDTDSREADGLMDRNQLFNDAPGLETGFTRRCSVEADKENGVPNK